jgi:ketosteroid isomerase-like protein
MKHWAAAAGAVAFVVAAGCQQPPQRMNEAYRAALADSVARVASEMVASFAQPAQATAEHMLSYYVRGNDLLHAEYGMIYPTYDSLAKAAAAMFRPGMTFKATLDQERTVVLDRDVVVLVAMVNGTMTDSAGKAMPVREAWLAVYQRTPDGWKIAADNESVAPPTPTARPARR